MSNANVAQQTTIVEPRKRKSIMQIAVEDGIQEGVSYTLQPIRYWFITLMFAAVLSMAIIATFVVMETIPKPTTTAPTTTKDVQYNEGNERKCACSSN